METKTALIVDDSKTARIGLKKKLEAQSITVVLAGSGEDALIAMEKQLPDLVFMDCMMPGIDGYETTRRIKANAAWRSLPVIMCTSHEGDAYEKQALDAGAIGYLVKPATAEKIDVVLAKVRELAAAVADETEPAVAQEVPAAPSVEAHADVNQDQLQAMAEEWAAKAARTIVNALVPELVEKQVSALADTTIKETAVTIAETTTKQLATEIAETTATTIATTIATTTVTGIAQEVAKQIATAVVNEHIASSAEKEHELSATVAEISSTVTASVGENVATIVSETVADQLKQATDALIIDLEAKLTATINDQIKAALEPFEQELQEHTKTATTRWLEDNSTILLKSESAQAAIQQISQTNLPGPQPDWLARIIGLLALAAVLCPLVMRYLA